jgi:hypothetical protein
VPEQAQPKRPRGRPALDPDEKAQRLELRLDPELHACLVELASIGGYGGRDKAAVGRYLIERSIDDLKRGGVLPRRMIEPPPVH